MTVIDQHNDRPSLQEPTAVEFAITNVSPLGNEGDYSLIARDTDDYHLLALWLAQHPSPHTQRQYTRQARLFLEYQAKPLQAITFTDLSAWATQLTGADNSRKVKINAIKSLFSFAHRVGYLRVNPAIMLKPPRTPDRRHAKVLKEGEIHALIAHAKPGARGARTKAIIRTLYSAGLRIAELCALTWADVIPTKDDKANLIIWGKGAKQREAGISADTHAALLAIRQGAPDSAPVFRSRSGKPMDRTVIMRMLRKLAKQAGIERPISPHWFRHSHATHALARGANPGDVQAQLGHASLTTTSGYIHSSKSSADYLSV